MLFEDKEWDNAEKSNEDMKYYICTSWRGYKYIKKYKPSIAKLVLERHGYADMQLVR